MSRMSPSVTPLAPPSVRSVLVLPRFGASAPPDHRLASLATTEEVRHRASAWPPAKAYCRARSRPWVPAVLARPGDPHNGWIGRRDLLESSGKAQPP